MVGLIAVYFFLILAITRIVIEVWYFFKCHGRQECHNQKCFYKMIGPCYCRCFGSILSDEEEKMLLAYLNQMSQEAQALEENDSEP